MAGTQQDRAAPPTAPLSPAPRARPVGRGAPETLAHGWSGGRGGGSCPGLPAPPPPRPSPGPREQLTGGDGDRDSGAPTLPRAELCAPDGKEEGAGYVGVPAREGHLGGCEPRGLRRPGRRGRASLVSRPGQGRVPAPPDPAPQRSC